MNVTHRQASPARLIRATLPVDNRSEIAILDKLTKLSCYRAMTHSLTITLDGDTFDWLTRQATAEQSTPAAVVEELLRELSDPENIEGELMDRLLLQSADYFPAVMTLEEQDEHRDEIIDYLCGRIVEGFQQRAGEPLSDAETAALQNKLVERSQEVWSSR